MGSPPRMGYFQSLGDSCLLSLLPVPWVLAWSDGYRDECSTVAKAGCEGLGEVSWECFHPRAQQLGHLSWSRTS